ncbi:TPA: hypothetical protein ACS727_003517 [Providencia alcalifaciens]|uniref:hypothetical protein n=1 Tax=Providencia alcalifaciens TaxID=126385 RepID=UPI001CC6B796|nr:hypothetical protein NVI2019_NGLDDFDA_03914 [Providencia alcalifaciens]
MLKQFIVGCVVISFHVFASNYDIYIGGVQSNIVTLKDINRDGLQCCYAQYQYPSIGFIRSWGDIHEYEGYYLNDYGYIYRGKLDMKYYSILDEPYHYINDCSSFSLVKKSDVSSFFLDKNEGFAPFLGEYHF